MSVLRSTFQKRQGFTILELLVFSAIFSMVAITFIAILISITRVQLRETASAEVNQQSQFIMQTIQRYIEEASLIETPPNLATDTLTLRLRPTTDTVESFAITKIYYTAPSPADPGGIFLVPKEGDPPQPLNSNRVIIDDLTFTKRSHPGAHDSVDVTLTLHFKTSNPQKRFDQILQTSVARVSAATFDSDLNPTTSSLLHIGNAAQWDSINNILYFSGANIGVNETNPVYTLDIDGNLHVNAGSVFDGTSINFFESPVEIDQQNGGSLRLKSGSLDCSSGKEGLLRFTDSSTDAIEICMDPGSGLDWYSLYYTAP